ncbi:MAG TPA: tetratricopeptide repeat protein [Bryobacteraceae bacterium]|nr:tetratricopeptide repeat protein [Bryobacteraceae bacterium]
MRAIRVFAPVLAGILGLVSCNSDPNVAKKRYLDMGNKYFALGKYKNADIMYRRALEKDKLFGEAYYQLAITNLKEGSLNGAVPNFRKAVDLLKIQDPHHWDALMHVTDIYLAVAHDPQHLKDAETNINLLLTHDPNSFDGHRMKGDLNYVRAIEDVRHANRDAGKAELTDAVAEYHKADAVKPGEEGVIMQLAKCAVLEGNAADAETLYQKVIATNKTFQQPYNDLFRLYMVEGKKDQAEQLLKTAFQNNPKQYNFLTQRAYLYSVENRRQDMLDVLQEIKAHSKDFPKAYQVVGDFYIRLNDPDSAIREFREGISKDSAAKATYQKDIIAVLMAQRKRGEAAEINQQILKDNPNDGDARSLEASFMLDKGDVTRALAELQSVVTHSPDNVVARYNLGRAHLSRNEPEQARQAFQKAIELNPNYIPARLALAQLLVTRGDFDAALKEAAETVRIDRNNKYAPLIQSAALMGQKKYEEARTLLNAMLAKDPNSPDVLFQLGVINLAQGKYKEANEAFKRTYDLNPANSRGLMGMVESDMAQTKPDEAIKILEAEAAKAPNRLDLLRALGNTEVRVGRYDVALGYFNRVLNALDKDSKVRGDIYMRIGETYRRKGDYQNSIKALQEARKFLPDNPIVLSTLALVLDAAGQYEQANQVYMTVIKINPNDPVSLNNAAFLMEEHGGDLDQALTMAQKAKQLLPDLAEVSDTLGAIYLRKHLNGDAVDIFKDLVAKVPTSSTYHYHLGRAYYAQGDKTKATAQLNLALKYSPTPTEKGQIQELLLKSQ